MNYTTKKCEYCEKMFDINLDNKQSKNRRFCSISCSSKIINKGKNNGKKRTIEFKENLSNRYLGDGNPFYGKKHKKESITKMSKSSQWDEDKFKYCNMSKTEKEIFDGILISDGSLSKSRISARLTFGFKYLETINRIIDDLKSIKFLKPWKYNYFDSRTNNEYINYFTKSNSYRDLLYEYNRWYKNGIKNIPNDLEITPLLSYWWFICDGYILKDNVYLCTDSFNADDLKIIQLKFKELNFNVSITKNNRIFFKKESSLNFLKWISTDINIQNEYLYKWNIKNKITI